MPDTGNHIGSMPSDWYGDQPYGWLDTTDIMCCMSCEEVYYPRDLEQEGVCPQCGGAIEEPYWRSEPHVTGGV